jgi:glycosyltransferase involved in cell wall biosynthesis
LKQIFFTVTNDLSYDQRMHRICTTLAREGYQVTLVGRKLKQSRELDQKDFHQKRLRCFFNSGFLFYAEYNIRLFFYLLTKKMDAVCAIDLDTILPCLFISKLKNAVRIYDAHEYFTELKEVRTRPMVKKVWTWIERFAVPKFHHGYTVGEGLAAEFRKRYDRNYSVVRNLPVLKTETNVHEQTKSFLLYQGVVNEARGFEYLIPAMKQIPYKLVVCGDGNFMPRLKALINEHGVEDKVELKGMLPPEALRPIAVNAALGLSLAEKEGINQYLALPNKFFEYIHAGVPQLAMNYPEYARINSQFEVALLIGDLRPETIASAINHIMQDRERRAMMKANCLKAREVLNWQSEEKLLIGFYRSVFAS